MFYVKEKYVLSHGYVFYKNSKIAANYKVKEFRIFG